MIFLNFFKSYKFNFWIVYIGLVGNLFVIWLIVSKLGVIISWLCVDIGSGFF